MAIPDVAARFHAYRKKNPTWGTLHAVMERGVITDEAVLLSIGLAKTRGDDEGAALGQILFSMRKDQRRKLPYFLAANREY